MIVRKTRKRKTFTLLELMICLVLIGTISSAVFVKGSQLVQHHRFKCAAQTFLLDLKRWRILAMTTGADVTCKIKKEGKNFLISWHPDFSLAKEESSYGLTETREVYLKGKAVDTLLTFTIFSSGRISSPDFLTLEPKDKENALTLDLSYPRFFEIGPFNLSMKTALERSSAPIYPERKKDM